MIAGAEAGGTKQSLIGVRLAGRDDLLDVLRWRNDDLARAMSRQTALIKEDTHRKWFARALDSQDMVLMIGELAGVAIGMVRFDRIDSFRWEVSIVIAAEARGRNISRALLAEAISVFFDAYPLSTIIASIRKHNERSLRLFRSLGFLPVSLDGDLTVHVLHARGAGCSVAHSIEAQ